MGLSSSQGRLLMLTSRLNDIQLQEVMVSQRQGQLAFQSEKAAQVYNEALSNFKLTIKLPDASEDSSFRTEDLSYKNMTQQGYLLTNADGALCLTRPAHAEEQEKKLLIAQLANASEEDKVGIQEKIDALQIKIDEKIAANEGNEWNIPKDTNGDPLFEIVDGKAIIPGEEPLNIVDATDMLSSPKIMQNFIMNGVLFVNNTKSGEYGMTMELLQSDNYIEYVLDTSDDAEAESEYQYETASLKRKENQLDIELNQLETQHNAVIKEIESVNEVIKNNVDRTFKLFTSKG